MKKVFFLFASFAALLFFASCDSKTCYCYDNGREEVLYVNSDASCGAYSSGRRGCVEENERMNAGDIAQEVKKLKAQQ